MQTSLVLRHQSIWVRALGLLAAALVVVAWPSTHAHEASVQHVVCAEHGERIDVNAVPAPHADEGPRLASVPEEKGHDHCPLLVLGPAGEQRPRGPEPLVLPLRVPPEIRGVREARFASVPLLAQAPKQSPPVGR